MLRIIFGSKSEVTSRVAGMKEAPRRRSARLRLNQPSRLMSDSDSSTSRTESPLSGLRRSIGGRHRKKKTLVLDLDETLVHSTSRSNTIRGPLSLNTNTKQHDLMVEVLIDKHICLYYVYKRPHVDMFLKKVSEWYRLVIFTASMAEYADPVIDWLDSSRTLIAKH